MKENKWESRVARENIRCAWWTAFWVSSMALATFGPIFLWTAKSLTAAGILLNLGAGVGVILQYRRWLSKLDELQKRIQFEAMALALGVGVVGGLSFSLLDTTNLMPFDAEISVLVVAISLTYMCGLAVGHLRYK